MSFRRTTLGRAVELALHGGIEAIKAFYLVQGWDAFLEPRCEGAASAPGALLRLALLGVVVAAETAASLREGQALARFRRGPASAHLLQWLLLAACVVCRGAHFFGAYLQMLDYPCGRGLLEAIEQRAVMGPVLAVLSCLLAYEWSRGGRLLAIVAFVALFSLWLARAARVFFDRLAMRQRGTLSASPSRVDATGADRRNVGTYAAARGPPLNRRKRLSPTPPGRRWAASLGGTPSTPHTKRARTR